MNMRISEYTNKRMEFGFTLIEMMVVICLLGLILSTVTVFFLSTMNTTAKAEVIKEVRQNGNYAISMMEGMIRSSLRVSSPCSEAGTENSGQGLSLINASGGSYAFVFDIPTKRIGLSNNDVGTTSFLTSTNVEVSGFSVICSQSPGKPAKINLKFSLVQTNSTTSRTKPVSLDFEDSILMKNF